MTQKDYIKALEYINKSNEKLELSMSRDEIKSPTIISRLKVSNFYYSAEIHYKCHRYGEALREFQQAADLADSIKWQRLSNYSYNYIALIYIEMDNFLEAKEILEKGLKDAIHSREIRRIALYELAFALLSEKTRNYRAAINYSNSCLEVFRNSWMQEEVAIAESIIERCLAHKS